MDALTNVTSPETVDGISKHNRKRFAIGDVVMVRATVRSTRRWVQGKGGVRTLSRWTTEPFEAVVIGTMRRYEGHGHTDADGVQEWYPARSVALWQVRVKPWNKPLEVDDCDIEAKEAVQPESVHARRLGTVSCIDTARGGDR